MASWNMNILNGSLKGAIERKSKELQDLDNGNPSIHESIQKVEKELDSLQKEEEKYWKLRFREDWLKWGEKKY